VTSSLPWQLDKKLVQPEVTNKGLPGLAAPGACEGPTERCLKGKRGVGKVLSRLLLFQPPHCWSVVTDGSLGSYRSDWLPGHWPPSRSWPSTYVYAWGVAAATPTAFIACLAV
jgi:hypothetical protein